MSVTSNREKRLSIHVYGGGSLGLLFAAKLAANEHVRVTLVVRTFGQAADVLTHGLDALEIVGSHSKGRSHPDCVTFTELQEAHPADIVLLTIKQTHIDDAFAQHFFQIYGHSVPVVCLQNGRGHIEQLRRFGSVSLIYSAVTTEGARKMGNTTVEHTGRGETIIGMELPNDPTPVIHSDVMTWIERMNEVGFSASWSEQIDFFIWRKWFINAVINPLTAATRLRNGELQFHPQLVRTIEELCTEALALAEQAQISGMQDLLDWVESVCKATAQNQSSMLQDVLQGRPTELEAITGSLLRLAETYGLHMATHSRLYFWLSEQIAAKSAVQHLEASMHTETIYWPQAKSFAQDYIERNKWAVSQLGAHETDDEAWQRQAEFLDRVTFAANRTRLCDAMESFYARLTGEGAANAPVHANIQVLREHRTLAVVGGQQVGLFGGPLLVIHKAVSIISAANEAQKRLTRPVVPVFWLAGEDHDWDEVNHLYVYGERHKPHKIAVTSNTENVTSVSQRNVPPEAWQDVIEQLRNTLQHTEFTEDLLAQLEKYALNSATLTELFARLMHEWFGKYGLLLVDAADPAIRELETEMFATLFAKRHELSSAIAQDSAEMVKQGYSSQVQIQEGQTNLFVEINQQRTMLMERMDDCGSHFSDRRNTFSWTATEVEQLIQSSPQHFSNNVLTRPLMQQYLFPVVATVLGRAETAYWALLPEAFRRLEMSMPVVVVRRECTVIEPPIARLMKKIDMSFGAVTYSYEATKKEWLQKQDQQQWPTTFADVKRQVADLYAPIIEGLDRINAGIGQLGRQNLLKMEEQVRFLETRTLAAFEQQHSAFLRQWERLHDALYPFGKSQERVYNVLAFINRNGTAWMSQLVDEATQWKADQHHLVYITSHLEEDK